MLPYRVVCDTLRIEIKEDSVKTFQSTLENIEKNVHSLEWTTDTGHTLHGVLFKSGDRLLLNVNPKELKETVNFEYLYSAGRLNGSRRVLYPHDTSDSKYIPADTFSVSWPIEVFMLIDEHKHPEIADDKRMVYSYDSFIHHRIPETKSEIKRFDKLMTKIQYLDTKVGTVTVDLAPSTSISMKPSRTEKSMDTISITINFKNELSNNEILMWNVRFSQLLTILHREKVILTEMVRGLDDVLVPLLVEEYEEANYAYRSPIDIETFVEFIQNTLPAFVDNYDDIANLVEDIVQYYIDYPSSPPDNIQLLRLFSGLEQCVNHYGSSLPKRSKKLSRSETKRSNDFDKLLALAESDTTVPETLLTFLSDESKKFYVKPFNEASMKQKIVTFGEFLTKRFNTYTHLKSLDNAGIIWNMRATVAHGYYSEKVRSKFYERRDEFGQDIERSIRIYLLFQLCKKKSFVLKHKEPLKAHQFSSS